MIQARKQSTTTYPVVFLMVDSNDHVTGKTGLTPTVTISKNGAAFGAVAGAVSELTNGWYALAGNATDRNTLGSLAIHASASGADACDVLVQIVSYDPMVDLATILADYARRTGDYSTLAAGAAMDLIDTLKNVAGATGYDRLTDSLEALGEVGGNGGDKILIYTLTNSVTLAPVAGATIELYATAAMTGDLIDSQTTDAFGVATFSNLVAGTYYLKIIKSGFATTTDSEAVS